MSSLSSACSDLGADAYSLAASMRSEPGSWDLVIFSFELRSKSVHAEPNHHLNLLPNPNSSRRHITSFVHFVRSLIAKHRLDESDCLRLKTTRNIEFRSETAIHIPFGCGAVASWWGNNKLPQELLTWDLTWGSDPLAANSELFPISACSRLAAGLSGRPLVIHTGTDDPPSWATRWIGRYEVAPRK